MPRKQTKVVEENEVVEGRKLPLAPRAPEEDDEEEEIPTKKAKRGNSSRDCAEDDEEPEPVKRRATAALANKAAADKGTTKRRPSSPSPSAPSKSHYKLVSAHDDGVTMKEIASAQGIDFSRGEAFYELTKKEKVSAKKGLLIFQDGKFLADDVPSIRTQLLKVGAGDVDIAPSNVPGRFQLFVQSTSANRKIPEDAAVVFVVDGSDSEDDAGSEGGSEDEEDDDDDDNSLDTVGRFDQHTKNSAALKDTARDAFFKSSNHYKWTGSAGRSYTVWAYKKAGEMSSAGHKWPHAFVDEESQTVNAAAWAVNETGALTLACLWTFSPGGDETNEYYVEAYKKDMWEFSGLCNGFSSDSPITDENSREHFSVSSGDYLVSEFHCPALETVTAAEMQAFEKKYGRK